MNVVTLGNAVVTHKSQCTPGVTEEAKPFFRNRHPELSTVGHGKNVNDVIPRHCELETIGGQRKKSE
jgi:hypothetical protein